MTNPPAATADQTFLFHQSKLVLLWPDGSQESFRLVEPLVRVGRGAANNDIAAPDEYKSISRKHLELRREGAVYLAADLGSTNGVYVNNERIEAPTVLQDGDQLQIGSEVMGQHLVMTYQMGGEAAAVSQDFRMESMESEAFSEFLTQPPRDGSYLDIRWPNGETNHFPLNQEFTLLGRADKADLRFPSQLKFISGEHAQIWRGDEGWHVVDLHSTNGTRLNNKLIKPDLLTPLADGAVIRIGDDRFGISIGLTFHAATDADATLEGYSPVAETATIVAERTEILVGRDEGCELVLPTTDVSRAHARILQIDDRYFIEDLGSTNGTFVNEMSVARAELHEGDQVQIGAHKLVFQDGQLVHYQSHGMRVDVTNLSKDVKTRSGPLRILHNIDMTVLPREFIAVVGGSGAGKSTFMNALIGAKPGDGQVQLNGHNFYQEYEHFRGQLGYVPQADILHTELSVDKALDYAARLRLPSDVSAKERKARIATVLETVSMNTDTIRQTRVSNLSGGQRKRVSIAAELLADPKLIYLDEATSGLDPGLEKKMMYTLRQMADEGRTVVLVTHATGNIVQTDHVAFLSQGKLVYFGPSQEALDFFEVDDFADIYERIERHGDEWQEVFQEKKPEQHQEFVVTRQQTKPQAQKRDLPKIRFGIRDFFRQFGVLTQRAFNVLTSDWFTLGLMLLLFPFTAALQLIISNVDILVGNLDILANPVEAAKHLSESYIPFADLNTFVFVMGLEAVLVGMYVPSNELIKERTVYLRERMVNLKVLPYLFSKIGVFATFAAIQTALYLVVLSLGIDLPKDGLLFPAPVELFITLYLTMLASMGIGFVVSAISKSSDMAIYVLVIMLFFQFFFAGTVFDLRDHPAEPLSYLTATRWALTGVGVTIGMEEQVEATIICNNLPDNPMTPNDESDEFACSHYPDATKDLMLPYDDEQLLKSWDILILMAVVTLTVTAILIKRLDQN